MSDISEGPGWWQASDGKWYPPDHNPGKATVGLNAPAGTPQEGVPRGLDHPRADTARLIASKTARSPRIRLLIGLVGVLAVGGVVIGLVAASSPTSPSASTSALTSFLRKEGVTKSEYACATAASHGITRLLRSPGQNGAILLSLAEEYGMDSVVYQTIERAFTTAFSLEIRTGYTVADAKAVSIIVQSCKQREAPPTTSVPPTPSTFGGGSATTATLPNRELAGASPGLAAAVRAKLKDPTVSGIVISERTVPTISTWVVYVVYGVQGSTICASSPGTCGGGLAQDVGGTWTVVSGPSTSIECATPATLVPPSVYRALDLTSCA